MGLADRLRRLEASIPTPPTEDDWPVEDQTAALISALQVHALGGTVYGATGRELALLDALIERSIVPQAARSLVRPMPLAEQAERERWFRVNWPEMKARRDG
jgi:hypothetical protein